MIVMRRPEPPLWQKLIRSRPFRRLVMLLIAFLLLSWTYDHYFGSKDDLQSSLPQPKIAPGRLATTPGSALYRLYNSIADGSREVCFIFDDNGMAAFARDFGAPTCEAVVERLKGRVDHDPRGFLRQAVGADQRAEVSSCAVNLEKGSLSLGLFVLTEPLPGEWIISDHRPEPAPCPEPRSGFGEAGY